MCGSGKLGEINLYNVKMRKENNEYNEYKEEVLMLTKVVPTLARVGVIVTVLAAVACFASTAVSNNTKRR